MHLLCLDMDYETRIRKQVNDGDRMYHIINVSGTQPTGFTSAHQPSCAARKPSDQLRRAPDTCGITAARTRPAKRQKAAVAHHATSRPAPRRGGRPRSGEAGGQAPSLPAAGFLTHPLPPRSGPGPAAQYCGAPRRPQGSGPQSFRAGGLRHRPAPPSTTLSNLASFSLLSSFLFLFPLPHTVPFNPALYINSCLLCNVFPITSCLTTLIGQIC